jgi:tRNA/tmRNA/rRNA uracil-C5-methylase (TrmA/RlmC/RlmD family)
VRGEAFYQSNRPLGKKLQDQVVSAVPEGVQSVLEGYAGTGFFSGPLSRRGIRVVAVESSAASVSAFQREAPQAELLQGRFEDHFEDALLKMGKGPSFCLINPPRGGLSPDARRFFERDLPFQGVLYLSCDPPALARDLRAWAAKWTPEWFQPIDLFPRTAHVECLVLLRSSSLSPSHSPLVARGS